MRQFKAETRARSSPFHIKLSRFIQHAAWYLAKSSRDIKEFKDYSHLSAKQRAFIVLHFYFRYSSRHHIHVYVELLGPAGPYYV